MRKGENNLDVRVGLLLLLLMSSAFLVIPLSEQGVGGSMMVVRGNEGESEPKAGTAGGDIAVILEAALGRARAGDTDGAEKLLDIARNYAAVDATVELEDTLSEIEEIKKALPGRVGALLDMLREAEEAMDNYDLSTARELIEQVRASELYDATPRVQSQTRQSIEMMENLESTIRPLQAEAETLLGKAEGALEIGAVELARSYIEEALDMEIVGRVGALQERAALLNDRADDLEEEGIRITELLEEGYRRVDEWDLAGAGEVMRRIRDKNAYAVSEEYQQEAAQLETALTATSLEVSERRDKARAMLEAAGMAIDAWEFEAAEDLVEELGRMRVVEVFPALNRDVSMVEEELVEARETAREDIVQADKALAAAGEKMEAHDYAGARRYVEEVRGRDSYANTERIRTEADLVLRRLEAREQAAGEEVDAALKILDAAEQKVIDYELDDAEQLVGSVKDSPVYATDARVRGEVERLEGKIAAERTRLEDGRERLMALLGEAKEAIDEGEFVGAEAFIEKVRGDELYEHLPQVGAEVAVVTGELEGGRRRAEVLRESREKAEAMLAEAGELIEAGRFDRAANLLLRVRYEPAYREETDLREQTASLGSELEAGEREDRLARLKQEADRAFDGAEAKMKSWEFAGAREILDEIGRSRAYEEFGEVRERHGDYAERLERTIEAEKLWNAAMSAFEAGDYPLALENIGQYRELDVEVDQQFDDELAARERDIRAEVAASYRRDRQEERDRYLLVAGQMRKQFDAGDPYAASELYGVIDQADELLFTKNERADMRAFRHELEEELRKADEYHQEVSEQMEEARRLADEGRGMEALNRYRAAVGRVIDNGLRPEVGLEVLESYLDILDDVLPAALEGEAQRLKTQAEEELERLIALKPYYMAAFWVEHGSYDVAKESLEAVAEEESLEVEKREWAAGQLEGIDDRVSRLQDEELLAVQEGVDRADRLKEEARALRDDGERQAAEELERESEKLQLQSVMKRAQMALERKAYPKVADIVAQNAPLLRPHAGERDDVRRMLDVAEEWENAVRAGAMLEEALQQQQVAESEEAIRRLQGVELDPSPFEKFMPELEEAERILVTLEAPEQMIARLPGRDALQQRITQLRRERAVKESYLESARLFAASEIGRARDYANRSIRAIDTGEDEFDIERGFAERVLVEHGIHVAGEQLEAGEPRAAAEAIETVMDTSVYEVDRDVRKRVKGLRRRIQKAYDRHVAEELLARGRRYLSEDETERAGDMLAGVQGLETYSELPDVQEEATALSRAIRRRSQILQSKEQFAGDLTTILDSVERKAVRREIESAAALMGYVEGAQDVLETLALQERYSEVRGVFEREKEAAAKEERLAAAEELLGNARAAFEDGDYGVARRALDEAEATSGLELSAELKQQSAELAERIGRAEEMAEELIAVLERAGRLLEEEDLKQSGELLDQVEQTEGADEIPGVRERLAGLQEKLERETARTEAALIAEEIEELIEDREYRKADMLVSRARDSHYYERFEEFRDQVRGFGAEVGRAEQQARELYEKAVEASRRGEIEELKTLLDELREKYENTRLYAERL